MKGGIQKYFKTGSLKTKSPNVNKSLNTKQSDCDVIVISTDEDDLPDEETKIFKPKRIKVKGQKRKRKILEKSGSKRIKSNLAKTKVKSPGTERYAHMDGSENNSATKSSKINNVTTVKNITLKNEEVKLNVFQVKDKKAKMINEVATIHDDGQLESSATIEKRAYYLENFEMVIRDVRQNADDWSLFDGEDAGWIDKFGGLDIRCRKLYVRLFHRKNAWLTSNKISYPEISPDPTPYLDMLADMGFLLTSESEDFTLHEILALLPAPAVKMIAKSFRLTVHGPKSEMCKSIELLCKKQKSVFASNSNGVASAVLKQAKQLLGSCYKINKAVKKVFNRLLLVFDVTKGTEDDSEYSISTHNLNYGKHQQLSAILMEGMGRVVYPEYSIHRPTPIFGSRNELLEYEVAYQYLAEAQSATDGGDWKLADRICRQAGEVQSTTDINSTTQLSRLPTFLRSFSACAVYVKIQSLHVEVLQRLKKYQQAADVLKSLLQQDICTSRKGYWYERLALNLDQHLQDQDGAIEVIRTGVSDPNARVGHRIALVDRARKIKSLKKRKDLDDVIDATTIIAPKEVTIVGRLLPKRMQTGSARFMKGIPNNENDDVLLCSVEELALDHYRSIGYEQGLHGEGGTFSCLFCLLMWDIIFMDGLPDVFRTKYQSHPLDLYTDAFYEQRRDAIEKRLDDISSCGKNFNVLNCITDIWERYHGESCSAINWERFTSLQQVLSLVKCIGGDSLSGILRILCKDLRHRRSGLPDLVVWNDHSCKLVEVKGPGDRLSTNQRLWIDELTKLGVDVEVCHVSASASRKIGN